MSHLLEAVFVRLQVWHSFSKQAHAVYIDSSREARLERILLQKHDGISAMRPLKNEGFVYLLKRLLCPEK